MDKKISLLLVIVVFLSACSFQQQESTSFITEQDTQTNEPELIEENRPPNDDFQDTDTTDVASEYPPIPDANPLNITISLDEANSVEAEIGLEGGILEVTSADGTQFILEIPDFALLSPESIRITPISSIHGLPFENDQAVAVNLEPEGLVFFKPVVLRIILPSLYDEDLTVGFGSRGGGEDFHLQTSIENGNEIQLFLFHFSNYGIINAREAEIKRLNTLYTPSNAQNYAIEQYTIVHKLVNDDAARLDAFEKTMKQWFYSSLLTRIQNAAIFDDRLDAAIGEFLAWKNLVETYNYALFNGELELRMAAEMEQALDLLAAAIANTFEKAYTRCIQGNEPEQAIRMHRYGLTAKYLDLWDRSGLDEDSATDKLTSCFKFDFVFRSKIELSTSDGRKVSQVKATVPIKIDAAEDINSWGGVLTNTDDLTFEINTLDPLAPGCKLLSKSGRLGVGIIYNLNLNLHQPWKLIEFKALLLTPDFPEEIIKCQQLNETPVRFWRPMFQMANQPFFIGDGWWEVILPVVNKGELYAEEELYGEIPGLPNSMERSTYQLFHKPGE